MYSGTAILGIHRDQPKSNPNSKLRFNKPLDKKLDKLYPGQDFNADY